MIERAKQQGYTLVEVMLAIAIMAVITVMFFRQYLSMNYDKDIQLTQYNVNQMFLALAQYYKANCSVNYDYSTANALNPSAALDPANIAGGGTTGTHVFVDVSTQLVTPGFIDNWPFVRTPFIDYTKTNLGYVTQFNLTRATPSVSTNPPGNAPVGTAYRWQAQVAIAVPSTQNASTLLTVLGADCISTKIGNIVIPCPGGIGAVKYLVWARSPFSAHIQSATSVSSYWSTVPYLQQFNQLYYNDPFYNIQNAAAAAQEETNPTWTAAGSQTYLCN